jgi:hypothetical protein
MAHYIMAQGRDALSILKTRPDSTDLVEVEQVNGDVAIDHNKLRVHRCTARLAKALLADQNTPWYLSNTGADTIEG